MRDVFAAPDFAALHPGYNVPTPAYNPFSARS
jgi:hypothetical protein